MKKSKILVGTLMAAVILSSCGTKDQSSSVTESPQSEAAAQSGSTQTGGSAEEEALMAAVMSDDRTMEDIEALNTFLQSGYDDERAAVLAQMAYSETGNRSFLQTVLLIDGKQRDFEGIERTLHEMTQLRVGLVDDVKAPLQLFIDENDKESLHKLNEILKNEEQFDSLVNIYLMAELWDAYYTGGEDAAIEAFKQYRAEGRPNFRMNSETDFYVGEYNEAGQREGYGICIYAHTAKRDTGMYMGQWENGVRSGSGTALINERNYIRGNWQDDYLNGQATLTANRRVLEGTWEQGHPASPIEEYRDGTLARIHGIPDEQSETGFSEKAFHGEDVSYTSTCYDMEEHSFCWDCIQVEGEVH